MKALELQALATDLETRAAAAPPEVAAGLKVDATLLRTLAEDERHGASRRDWDAERSVPLDLPSVEVKQEDNGLLTVTLKGGICSWSTDIGALCRKIVGAEHGVLVKLDSGGGDALCAARLCEALQAKGPAASCEIVRACSGAALIAMGCARRRISRTGWIAVHSGAAAAVGSASWLRVIADQLELCEARLPGVFSEATGLPMEVTRQWFDGSHVFYFNAEDSLKVGLAHEVF